MGLVGVAFGSLIPTVSHRVIVARRCGDRLVIEE
jgi:hypothetical protein